MINNISNLFQIIYKNARPEEIATEEPNTYKNCFMCDFELLESTQFTKNRVCPKCNFHYTMSAKQRIESLIDINSFMLSFKST